MIPVILVLLFLGLIPAYIAQTKGRSFGAWYVYGLFLLPITLIHSLLLPSNDKKCPQCAELVKIDAKICKHCGNKLGDQPSEQQEKIDDGREPINNKEDMKMLLMLILGLSVIIFVIAAIGWGLQSVLKYFDLMQWLQYFE